MTKRLCADLEALIPDPEGAAGFLTSHSGLPGRRANLELAAVLADLAAAGALEPVWSQTLVAWSRIPASEAPTNHPREFLPFCAVQALGALHTHVTEALRAEIESALRRAANDSRWRLREACAFGLQRVGTSSPSSLMQLIEAWVQAPTLLELRAVLVGLADPGLLETPAMVTFALETADRVMDAAISSGEDALHSEPGKVLQKALGFAPSVLVAAAPVEGFPLLEAWADRGSITAAKAVAANLRKARLARHFPDEVQDVGLRLQAAVFD